MTDGEPPLYPHYNVVEYSVPVWSFQLKGIYFPLVPDPFQIFQRISCASNEDIVSIREMLAERARHHKEEIRPEMENIAKLKQIMCDYIDGKKPTIKNVMIEEFAKELDKILKNNQNWMW